MLKGMQALARFLFFVEGLLSLVVAARLTVDETSLALWRKQDAIWGPGALPFNAAGLLAVGFAYLYATLSPATFRPGVRWRIAAFIGLNLLVMASLGRWTPILSAWLILFFVMGCLERDEKRRERKPARSLIA